MSLLNIRNKFNNFFDDFFNDDDFFSFRSPFSEVEVGRISQKPEKQNKAERKKAKKLLQEKRQCNCNCKCSGGEASKEPEDDIQVIDENKKEIPLVADKSTAVVEDKTAKEDKENKVAEKRNSNNYVINLNREIETRKGKKHIETEVKRKEEKSDNFHSYSLMTSKVINYTPFEKNHQLDKDENIVKIDKDNKIINENGKRKQISVIRKTYKDGRTVIEKNEKEL